MSLRRRLTLAYGGVVAVILTVALGLAYAIHVEGHDADVDTVLGAIVDDARADIADQLDSGTPLELVTLTLVHRAIDEPIDVVLYDGGHLIAQAGYAEAGTRAGTDLARLAPGWSTSWSEWGRFRSFVSPISGSDLRLVATADLSGIDGANEQLRWALVILGATGVGLGMAIASLVAGYALRPVAQLTATAADIAATRDFSRRVHVGGRDDEDELANLGRTFDRMLTSLDTAYRDQQRFLGDVSHELRTPLTTIRGNAELLAGDQCAHDHATEITQIRRESDRLARLVDELLVLARSKAVEPFAPQHLQLDEVVMEAFDELRTRAGDRLHVRWLEAVPLAGERDRLKQLVVALVDNAIRYTPPPGRIDLSLAVEGRDAVLRIEDEGIGLSDAAPDRLFDRFYRGPVARRIEPEGSGLGLAIVKWIVERHGGAIRIEPRAERGTCVTVRLPVT